MDLNSFLAFGREYVMWNHKKTGNSVYLNIKERPKPVSEDRPHKKPTLLAIGMCSLFFQKFQAPLPSVMFAQFSGAYLLPARIEFLA